MKLSKSQKIWIGLLGVGVVALGIDQAGGSSQAAAAITESITVDGNGNSIASASRLDPGLPNVHQQLAGRLQSLSESADPFNSIRDAFSPLRGGPAPLDGPVTETSEVTAAQFAGSHQLRAIFSSGPRRQAWVNNSMIDLGQRLDTATLVAVDGMTATFDLGGTRVVLRLPDAPIENR